MAADDEIMDEFETITLVDNGEEIEFVILDSIEDNGNTYVLAVEASQIEDEEAEANLFKKVKTDDGDVYELIEDDDEFNKIADIFQLTSSEDYDVETEEY